MFGSRRQQLAELQHRIEALEKAQAEEPSWISRVTEGLAAAAVSIIVATTAPIVTAVLRDDANACSVEYTNVASAVKAGVRDPTVFKPLAEDDCDVDPTDVGADMIAHLSVHADTATGAD